MKININNKQLVLHKEGIPFVCLFLVLSIISISIYGLNFLTFLLMCLVLFMLFFFRRPERVLNLDENNILSPADGTIKDIEEVKITEILGENEFKDNVFNKISISIGILDSHIQRTPVSAKVIDVKYEEGKFLNTSLEKENKDNEKNHIVLKKNDKIFVVSQISGLISRRIVCYLKINEDVDQGQEYGIIKFGSQVNLYIPKECKISIKKGQTVVAGETVLGFLK